MERKSINKIKIKEPIIDFVSNSISGLERCENVLYLNETSKKSFPLIEVILKDLKRNLEAVQDNSSKEAFKKSIEVFNLVKSLRKKISNQTLTVYDCGEYKDKFDFLLKEWNNLDINFNKRLKKDDRYVSKGGKKVLLSDVDFDEFNDDFRYFITSEKYIQKFTVYKEQILNFKSSFDLRKQHNDELLERIRNTEKEISENKRSQIEIKAKFDNKRLDAKTAALKIKELQNKCVTLENSLTINEKKYRSQDASIFKSLEFADTLLIDINEILSDENIRNPKLLYAYYEKFNLDAAVALLQGVATIDEIKNAKESIERMKTTTFEFYKNLDEPIADLIFDFNDIYDEYQPQDEKLLDSNNKLTDDEAMDILNSVESIVIDDKEEDDEEIIDDSYLDENIGNTEA